MEHDDLRALTAAYALDGLDPDEERALEEHVRHCAECRADLASFRETAVALATDVEPVPPPPHLREQILQTVRAERFAAAACAAAVGLGVWAVSLSHRLDARPQAVQLVGAQGRLVVTPSGEGTLVVSGLRPAPTGKTYEAWVIRGGQATPAGTFHGGSGRTAVALTAPIPDGAVVGVTLERAPGASQPSQAPLFTSQPV
ncbi:MAG: hypothetical protein E6G67_01770 [Actinobacteria bacterium]|nr:MAG: hypothetical protein E6G67_01770 [Actinomycetota bacterium]